MTIFHESHFSDDTFRSRVEYRVWFMVFLLTAQCCSLVLSQKCLQQTWKPSDHQFTFWKHYTLGMCKVCHYSFCFYIKGIHSSPSMSSQLKTVSSENVSSCKLVKFHLHTPPHSLHMSIKNGECWTNGQEIPVELLPLFVSVTDSSLEIYSTIQLNCANWSPPVWCLLVASWSFQSTTSCDTTENPAIIKNLRCGCRMG